uniref:Uncharacterized protein n=1 Tax=Meloidogyne enterolobii TaxID=390850 RepID=A0A6V7VM69_MELEN|nr:unnamed protein product [Meloidogyne enterolobii]
MGTVFYNEGLPSYGYELGVDDGIVDALGHLSGKLQNERVQKFLDKFASVNPTVDINLVFPFRSALGNKNVDDLSRKEKQNMRRKLLKMNKSAKKKGA